MRTLSRLFAFAILATPLAVLAQAAGDYQNFRGSWQGSLEFTVTEGANPKAVSKGAIKVAPEGALTGSSESGCKFTGTARQVSVSAPTNGTLVVVVTGCKDARFNMEFSGILAVSQSEKSAFLTLTPSAAGIPGRPTIHGTIGR